MALTATTDGLTLLEPSIWDLNEVNLGLQPLPLCHCIAGQPREDRCPYVMQSDDTLPPTSFSQSQPDGCVSSSYAQSHIGSWSHLRWFSLSVYRRLCILILVGNVTILIVNSIKRKTSLDFAAAAVSVNVAIGVLVRQELVINLLFRLFAACPTSLPLALRRRAANIYHLGGVHSGTTMAATLWFAVFNVTLFIAIETGDIHYNTRATATITVILDILLFIIVVMAYPLFRARMHNAFELTHRFAGWFAIALFWALLGLLIYHKIRSGAGTPFRVVIRSPVSWSLLISTISIALPWVHLRKTPISVEVLSSHAIRLHFDYSGLVPCSAVRLSTRPLFEWHAFAGIPHEGGTGFSVLVSNAGDWTAQLIRSPPSALWVRGIPTIGVLYMASIFKKVVLVATGSGIGPILSLLSQKNVRCRILWSTPDPETFFSERIVQKVRDADAQAKIINTTVSGRPNLVEETHLIYETSGAEAVFVISNPKVTRKVVFNLERRGILALAPIFDS